MKKRFLSAALALAMVLTLIPATIVPAFAAVEYGAISSTLPGSTIKSQTLDKDGNVTKTTYYYEDVTNANGVRTITTVTVQRFTGGNDGTNRVYGGWYWLDNRIAQAPQYHEVTSGFIAGNNGSGLWYPDLDAFTTTTKINYNGTPNTAATKLRSTSLTLLGDSTNLNMGSGVWADTTLNVDIEGAGTLTLAENATNVTVTSKFQSTQVGNVAAITRDHSDYSATAPGNAALTLNATNVNVGDISLTGRGNSVTLDNCAAGSISMEGSYWSSAANKTAGASAYTWAGQTLTTKNKTTISGGITINGDNNRVQIADTDADGQTLSVTGAGTVSISGTTKLGNITATARSITGAFPTVNVSGGTVGTITQPLVSGNKNSITINVSNTNTETKDITVEKGTVNLTNGNVKGDVTVKAGALNATQDNVHVSGTLTLGATDVVNLNLSATNSTYGGIAVTKGSNLKITGWNGKRVVEGNGSNYGLVLINDYAGNGITGGSFKKGSQFHTVAKMKWLGPNVQFYVTNDTTNTVDLYDADELARAISDITTENAAVAGKIIVVGQTAKQNIVLKNGQNTWAQIGYSATTGLIMPESINGMKITQWYAPKNHNIILTSGVVQGVPFGSEDLELNASGVIAEAKKLTNVTVSKATTVKNRDIRVALNGNNIALSGAVQAGAGNIATIYVDLTTDAIDESGAPIKLEGVAIDYYPNTRQVKFNMIQPTTVGDAGGVIQDQGAKLVLNNGTGESYTVSATLAVSADTLGLYMGESDKSPIVVTTGGKLSSWSLLERQALIDQIQGNGTFTIGDNRAVLEAINAAQATITSDNTVSGWITSAKNNIWRQGFKSVKPGTTVNTGTNGFAVSNAVALTPNTGAFDSTSAQGAEIASLFTNAYIVPYLVVNITDYDRNGSMTATLTPYYRVDVSGSTYDTDFYYTVQPGRAMSALTGTMCPNGVVVDLGLADSAFQGKYMHQDGKYVYKAGASNYQWTITHAGNSGNGLGSIVINNLVGPISMESDIDSRSPSITQLGCTYDDLQAAIDDTVRGAIIQTSGDVDGILVVGETMDTVKIGGDYTKSCTFTMTGIARKVKINAVGQQQEVTATGANVVLEKLSTQVAGGYVYAVELKNDAVAAGTVALAAQGTTQGTVTLPATTAKVGQTVTVTVVPTVAGQTAKGVTVTTNDGTVVPATATGKTNEFSFVVPNGATSITVTPNFAVATAAVFTAVPTNQGTVRAHTSTTDGTAQQGTIVPVTVTPASNYRTMGLTARGNNGVSATVNQIDANTFNVTVPIGATTVTLTPSFDFNNGTPFVDVMSKDWSSPYVSWMYLNDYTTGSGDSYHFEPTRNAYRWEMVLFLYKAAGYPSVAGMSNPFRDVNSNNFYYNAVVWAANKGLIDSSTGYFNPASSITRADVVSIIWKHKGSPSASTKSGFKDVPTTASYAKAVSWAEKMGITNGKDNRDTFKPNVAITRQEIAKMIYIAFG